MVLTGIIRVLTADLHDTTGRVCWRSAPYDRLILVGGSTVGALDSLVCYDLPFELIERGAGPWGNELQPSHGTGRLYEF
jgi:hypothetical protein